MGSKEAATALSGVNVVRWKITIYTMAGLFVGIAGVLAASRLSSAQPVGGMGLELEAVAAVGIGGTSLHGGRGSSTGTVVGSLIVAALTTGVGLPGARGEGQPVVGGCVTLVAVYVDMLRRKGPKPHKPHRRTRDPAVATPRSNTAVATPQSHHRHPGSAPTPQR